MTRKIDLSHSRLTVAGLEGESDLPTLLLIHGAYHGSWCYETYMAFFEAQHIPVAAIDLRGRVGLPQDGLFLRSGAREMAEDVIEACKAIGREVVVGGHSAGGLVAGVVASRYPTVGLILLAPSPPGQLPGLRPLPAEPEDAPVPPPSEAEARRKFLPNHGGREISAYLAKLCPESPAQLNDRRLLRIPVVRESISGPALCLAAEKEDPAMHAPGQDYATARFYDAEYHFLRGAAHCFMLEDNWEFGARIILRWYRKHFPV